MYHSLGNKKSSRIQSMGNKVLSLNSSLGGKHTINSLHKKLYHGQSDIYKNTSNNSSLIFIPTGLKKII